MWRLPNVVPHPATDRYFKHSVWSGKTQNNTSSQVRPSVHFHVFMCFVLVTVLILVFRSSTNACRVMTLGCQQSVESCHYMLRSNKLGSVVDLLTSRLASIGEENVTNVLPADSLASSLMELLSTVMASIPPPTAEEIAQSRMDLVR